MYILITRITSFRINYSNNLLSITILNAVPIEIVLITGINKTNIFYVKHSLLLFSTIIYDNNNSLVKGERLFLSIKNTKE